MFFFSGIVSGMMCVKFWGEIYLKICWSLDWSLDWTDGLNFWGVRVFAEAILKSSRNKKHPNKKTPNTKGKPRA